ncbi:thioredoxin domain-containing protein [Anaplasmataceae bacterium AB001_6]|nr:thioredoxin domain-containing protein [Anaplasmataceae bacterium AB001_6]
MRNFIIFIVLFILTVMISVVSYVLYTSYEKPESLTHLDQKISLWVENNPEKIISSVDKMYEKEHALKMQEIVHNAKNKYGAQVIDSEIIPFIGESNSENILLEFVDYSCFYCKMTRDHPEDLTQYIPDLKFIVVPVTLMGGERSKLISKYSIGVFIYDNEKFNDFHISLFSLNGEIDKEKLNDLLRDVDIDPEKFANLLEEKAEEIENQIAANNKFFAALHSGTPSFLYDKTLFIGVVKVSDLFNAITGTSLPPEEASEEENIGIEIKEEEFFITEKDIENALSSP